jgi:hypothetical protein
MAEFVFVRVRNCSTQLTRDNAHNSLYGLGEIVRSGAGVITDPTAWWCVIRLRRGLRPEGIREELSRLGLASWASSWVDRIERVLSAVEGDTLARQLPLCG